MAFDPDAYLKNKKPREATNPNPLTTLPPDKAQAVDDVLDDEEKGREAIRFNVQQEKGEQYDDAQLDAYLEENYGTNKVQPAMTDLDSWYGHKETKQYKMQGKNPLTFGKLTMGKTAESVSKGLGGLLEGGARLLFRTDLDIREEQQAQTDFAEGRAYAEQHGLGDELPKTFNPPENFKTKAVGFAEMMHDSMRDHGEYLEKWWRSGIDPEIRGSWFDKATSVPAETLQLGMYAAPGIGQAYAYGRLFDEMQGEMLDNGYDRDTASSAALSYAAFWGPTEIAIDRFTMGAGSRFMRPGSSLLRKSAGVGVDSLVSGVGEAVTEMPQDMHVQYASTGKIDYKQTREAGIIAFASGVLGGELYGTAGMIDAHRAERARTDLDKMETLNERFKVTKPQVPTDVRPWTFADIQGVRRNSTDREIELMVTDMDESVRSAALNAFNRPSMDAVNELNNAVERVSEHRNNMKATHRAEVDPEADVAPVSDEAQEPASTGDERTGNRFDEIGQHNAGTVVDDPVLGELEIKQRTTTPDGTVHELWVGAIGTVYVNKNAKTGDSYQTYGDSRTVAYEARERIESSRLNVETVETVEPVTEEPAPAPDKSINQQEEDSKSTIRVDNDIEQGTEEATELDEDIEHVLSADTEESFKARMAEFWGLYPNSQSKVGMQLKRAWEARQAENKQKEPLTAEDVLPINQMDEVAPAEEVAPAPEPETQDFGGQQSIYAGMSLTDMRELMADNIARGFPITNEFRLEVLKRHETEDEFKAFMAAVGTQARAVKAEIADIPTTQMPKIERQIISDPNAARMQDAAAQLFEETLWKLEFQLLPSNDYYRNDKDVIGYAKAAGKEVDDVLRWKGPEKRRARANQLKDRLEGSVLAGNVDAVVETLSQEGISLEGAFAFGMKTAANRMRISNEIQNRESNRTEVRETIARYGSDPVYEIVGEISTQGPRAIPQLKARYNPALVDQVLTAYAQIRQEGTYRNPAEVSRMISAQMAGLGVREDVAPYQVSPFGLYSQLTQFISEQDFESKPAGDLLNQLVGKNYPAKVAGAVQTGQVKLEEMQDIGLLDWLESQEGKVSKADILSFLNAGGIQLEQTVYGGGQERRVDLYDGDEVVLLGATMDEAEIFDTENEYTRVESGAGNTQHSQYQMDGDSSNYREFVMTLPERGNRFYSHGHWPGVKNPIVHFRTNDRTIDGKRVLFVEEIQSDWIQAGRKQGFGSGVQYRVVQEDGIVWGEFPTLAEAEGALDDAGEGSHITEFLGKSTVPDPGAFKKSGSVELLAIKRILKIATDEGYDAIAWTSGETQAVRWRDALRGEVNSIEWRQSGLFTKDQSDVDGFIARKEGWEEIISLKRKKIASNQDRVDDIEQQRFDITMKIMPLQKKIRDGEATTEDQEQFDRLTNLRQTLSDESYELSGRIEEEISEAQREIQRLDRLISSINQKASKPTIIIDRKHRGELTVSYNAETGIITESSEQADDFDITGKHLEELVGKEIATRLINEESGRIEKDGIVIGAKGFQDIYDRTLPKLTGKHVKKMGGKVGVTQVGETDVWHLPITDKMYSEIAKGQALYEATGDYLDSKNATATGKQRNHLQQEMTFIETEANPVVELFPAERAELGLEPENITPEERRELNARVFQAVNESIKNPDFDVTDEIKADVQRAIDLGIPISATVSELFKGDPFAWPLEATYIRTPQDVHAAAMVARSPYVESFKVLYVDDAGKVLEARIVSVGTLNSSLVHPRETFSGMPEGTTGVILSHNHPSGNPRPSDPDLDVTRQLVEAAEVMGVSVIDHVITNGQAIFSMREGSVINWQDDSQYSKDLENASYDDRKYYLDAQETAEWEVIRRDLLKKIITPEMAHRTAFILRQANPDRGVLMMQNTAGTVEGMISFDATKTAPEIIKDIADAVSRNKGVASIVIEIPGETPQAYHVRLAKMMRDQMGIMGVRVNDLLVNSDESFTSLREAGLVNFIPASGSGTFNEVAEEAETYGDFDNLTSDAMKEAQERSTTLEGIILKDIHVDLLNGLTAAEMETAMRYVASRQEYDDTVEPIPESELSPQFAEFLNEYWVPTAQRLSAELTEMKESLGMDFEALAGFYFPLRHNTTEQLEATSIADMIALSTGVAKHRAGKFDGVVLDPEQQIRDYVKDASRLIAIGTMIAEQREIVSQQIPQIVDALHNESQGIELASDDEAFTPSSDQAKAEFEKLQELEAEGETLGIPKSELGSTWLYRNLAMLQEDGGGQEVDSLFSALGEESGDGGLKDFIIRHGKSWSSIVDPSFIVQKMDGMEYGKSVNGRMYGANSRLLGDHLTAGRLIRDSLLKIRNEQRDLLTSHRDRKRLGKLNEKLHGLFLHSMEVQKDVLKARNPEYLQHMYQLTADEADIVFWYAKQIRIAYGKRAMQEDMQSDASHIAKDRVVNFRMLERKLQDGTATQEDVDRYLSYVPQNPRAETPSAYTYHAMMRNAARWFFERHAIDSKDFFGFFDSLTSSTAKGDYLSSVYKKTLAWADVLEGLGQNDNARWWRLRAESNLKGNNFEFEDTLLEIIGKGVKKVAGGIVDDSGETRLKGTGRGLDALRNASVEDIKARVVEAGGVIQRARIYNWLLGNVGWVLATQPSSLSLTVKQAGPLNTLKAFGNVLFGKHDPTLSDVEMIKNRREGLSALESVSEHETLSVKHGARSKARIALGWFADRMESHLTGVSYLAGYTSAKDSLGMTEDDARLHGEFVAATTQSMYDRISRNTALNSNLLRVLKPMQTFAFTQMSNMLDTFGVVGIKRSKLTRLREFLRWRMAAMLWNALWSIIFGDDILKALIDPTHNKSTVGSNLPVIGKGVDRTINLLPWKTNSYYNRPPHEQMWQNTGKVIKAIANDDPHAGREVALYALDYWLPYMGIAGGQMTKNFIKMQSARNEHGRYEKVTGDLYKDLGDLNNPLRWSGGVMFGTKAVDEPKSLAEQLEN